jgi:hypothetical protein
MKALVSAIALLSFVAAATVPAVAYADDAPASTTKAKKHSSKSTKTSGKSTSSKKSKKKAD